MSKKLTEIGIRYDTDKAYYHSFTDFYNDYFEKFVDRPINILEIGIFKGSSIQTLREYFPKATIYAIDINPHSVSLNLGDNVHTYLCSQDDFDTLKLLFRSIKFDIIIEDGSHITSHQQSSLGFFFPYLNEKGIYICEDLHTSYKTEYIDTQDTTLDMINNYQRFREIKSNVITNEQRMYLNNNIADCILYERTQNAYMCYKCKTHNINRKESCVSCNTDLSPSDKSITSIFLHK